MGVEHSPGFSGTYGLTVDLHLDLQSSERHSSRACYDPRMSVNEVLRGAAETLAGVNLLVVFGSAARGTDRPRSDVDVGVRLRDDSPAARRAVELALGRSLRREVDVVYLDEAPPLLRFQVARDGVLIHQAAPHLWPDFRARAMLDWWDWASTFRMIHDAGLRRLRRQAGGGPA